MTAVTGAGTDKTTPSATAGFGRRIRLPTWILNTIVLLALWQIASLLAGRTADGDRLVPGLLHVAAAFKLLGNYWPGGFGLRQTAAGGALTWEAAVLALFYNAALTMMRMFGGFALGIVLGLALAVGVSWSQSLRRAMIFPAHLARMLPLLALIPLFNLWLGNTEAAAILFVALVTFCVMFATTLGAIAAVPDYYAQYASSLGASAFRIYFAVILPAALPRVIVGIVLSHGFAWGAVIAAEFLGMQYGLGHIALMAQQFNQFNLLAVAAFITVALSIASYAALSGLLSTLVKWQ